MKRLLALFTIFIAVVSGQSDRLRIAGPGSLPGAQVGAPYSASVQASGGTLPYTWSVVSGALPAGITLSQAGVLTGTPTTAGSFGFRVQVTDARNANDERMFNITVAAALAVSTSSLPNAQTGSTYSATLAATGGTAPYVWTVASGSLPAGLTLASTGAITGIPTTAGTSSFTVRATDATLQSATAQLSIVVATPTTPVVIASTPLPGGRVGTAYSAALSASGGTPPYTWVVASGSLPAGLSLAADGTISGTPSGVGNSSFTVRATDAAGQSATAPFSIAIAASDPPVAVSTSALPEGRVGSAYSATLAASGGTGPYTWAIATGALPAGLTLASNGAISGTPTAAGTSNFTVRATDSTGQSGTAALSVVVTAAPVSVSTSSLPEGRVGTAYSATLAASGGTGPYTWAIATGSLPAGLTLASNGTISGTPTAAGTSNFTVRATDSTGQSGTAALSVVVAGAPVSVSTSSLPEGRVGSAYSATLAASGGTGPYTWAIATGSLPAGLTLASNGTISGTPTAAGTSNFTVRATDSTGQSGTAALSVVVAGAPVSISTSTLVSGVVGAPYLATLSASGGAAPYTFALASGALPAGLSLGANGAISGTPTTPSTSTFTVRVTDSVGGSASANYQLLVEAPLAISTTALAAGSVSAPYADTLSASGGTPPYTWSVSSGSLPPGLVLQQTGAITGTPASAGSFAFSVRVADSAGRSATAPMQISIAAGLSITSSSLNPGLSGTSYSQGLSATGGVPPYTWALVSGSLPPGVSLNASGVLTGTPSAAGEYSFSARVTDASNQSATASLVLSVVSGLGITTASLAPATVNTEYSQTLSATGGSQPYAWSVASGSLPPGVTLTQAGVIAGRPSEAGTYTATVRVTDSASRTAERAYSLLVSGQLSVASCPAGTASTGLLYSSTVSASGGTAPYTFSISSGSVAPGLALNSTNGTLAGTPVSAGNFSFTVLVRDNAGQTATRNCSIGVAATLRIETESLADATTRAPYAQQVVATGGTPPYRWTVLSGSLPPGLVLNNTAGILNGVPSQPGRFSFTLSVADQAGNSAERSFSLNVAAGVTIAACPVATASAGQRYTATLNAAGGTPPYVWSLGGGSLPSGITLAPETGTLAGTPTGAAESSFTLRVTDAVSGTATRSCTISVAVSLTLTTEALPDATTNAPYAATIVAAGGSPPYSYVVSSGTLPPGFSLNSAAGVLSGLSPQDGSYRFTVRVSDAAGVTAERNYSLNVVTGFAVSSCPVSLATVGQSYSSAFSVAGGEARAWSVTEGNLPAGLTLDPINGTVAGTPAEAGSSGFTVQAETASGVRSSRACAIAVSPSQLAITGGAALPNAVMDVAYDQTLVAEGGRGPYVWSLSGGSLPEGVTLLPDGRVQGIPTAIGSFAFTVRVTDGGQFVTRELVMTVLPSVPPILSYGALPEVISPAQQPRLNLSVDRAYPAALRGRLTLRFTPDPGLPDDRSILFVTGSRSVEFEVAPNSTEISLPVPQLAIQTGTVAGVIEISAQLFSGDRDITPPGGLRRSMRIERLPPVISTVRLAQRANGFDVTVTGYSTGREVSAASFTFVPATGRLDNPEVIVPTADAARAWFSDSRSQNFGGQFTFVQPFTVQGVTMREVTVRLTNGQGTSNPVRVEF